LAREYLLPVLAAGLLEMISKHPDLTGIENIYMSTILVVSHDSLALDRICDSIVTLDHGVAMSGVKI
jgi:ABC-type glutathione transport system ATPase component